jgi:hypothetical protein
MSAEWSLYQRWLKTGVVPADVPIKDGSVYAFYGHDHEFKSCAIFSKDGRWYGYRNRKPVDPARLLESLLRPKKLGTPVSYADYIANRDKGTPFPKERELQEKELERQTLREEAEKPASQDIGANLGPQSDIERIEEAGKELSRQIKLEDIRLQTREPEKASEETYRYFSTIAQKAHDLSEEANAIRLAATKPLRDQVEAINAAWKPVVAVIATTKDDAKNRTMPYHDRIERERLDLERRAGENRDKMATDSRIARRASGGTQTITKQNVEIVDIKALAMHFCSMPEPPNALVTVLAGLALFAVKSGIDIPGIKVTETRGVKI